MIVIVNFTFFAWDKDHNMDFINFIQAYFDPDDLIGNKPNPESCSDGNPLVAAASVLVTAKKNNLIQEKLFSERLKNGILKLIKANGFPIKKHCAPQDEVTHDDLIGLVSSLVFLDARLELDKFINFGILNSWNFVNVQGLYYWDGLQKPWDIHFLS